MKCSVTVLLVCLILAASPNGGIAEPTAVHLEPNEYIEVPSSPSLRGFNELTIECWFYPEAWGTFDNEHIFGIGYIEQDYFGLLAYPPVDSSVAIHYAFIVSGINYSIGTTATVSIGAWHHLAGVWDGSQLRLYLDGELADSRSLEVPSNLFHTTTPYWFNRHQWATGVSSRLRGRVDDARISDIAHYTSDFIPPNCLEVDESTRGLWHMDSGAGDVIIDASPNGNHGYFQGGVDWVDGIACAPSATRKVSWGSVKSLFR